MHIYISRGQEVRLNLKIKILKDKNKRIFLQIKKIKISYQL